MQLSNELFEGLGAGEGLGLLRSTRKPMRGRALETERQRLRAGSRQIPPLVIAGVFGPFGLALDEKAPNGGNNTNDWTCPGHETSSLQ